MYGSSTEPMSFPQAAPVAQSESKSESAGAAHDLWHSVFSWTFLMLIITPRPNVRRINKHRQRTSAANRNTKFLPRLSHLLSIAWGTFSTKVKGAFTALRARFTKSTHPVLPQYAPNSTRVDAPSEKTSAPSTNSNVPSVSDDMIQTPTQAVSPISRVPKPHDPTPLKTSPTTARFLSTLADLEAQMNNHQFYDLERELEDMENQMSQMFDFPWMPRQDNISPTPTLVPAPPRSPIPMILPQVPPPARRDGKTIQILPMICEVSENSSDAPPYDPRRWSIVAFQPLWGPRTQITAAY